MSEKNKNNVLILQQAIRDSLVISAITIREFTDMNEFSIGLSDDLMITIKFEKVEKEPDEITATRH